MIIKAYKAIVVSGKEEALETKLAGIKENIRSEYLQTEKIMNVNVFLLRNELYVYIESIEEEILPGDILHDVLEYLMVWPDYEDHYFYLLTEIFHFNEPQSIQHWSRKEKPLYCFGMIAKLVPEHTARYIYYHYQFQEERPGMGDKYGRIFLMGDLAFYYGEAPEIIEPAIHKGALNTSNTPDDEDWQNIMGTHFIWWDSCYPDCEAQNYDWKENGYPNGKSNNQWLYAKNILSVI